MRVRRPEFAWLLLGALVFPAATARGQDEDPPAEDQHTPKAGDGSRAPGAGEEYRTPRAGEEYRSRLLGTEVKVDARDRKETLALSLGSVYFSPRVGTQRFVPFAAAYWRRYWEERRVAAVLSGFVNEVDYAEQFGSVDALVHVENNTIPFPTQEIVDGQELGYTAMRWGWSGVWAGLGLRFPVAPGGVDNDLQFGCSYQASYAYFNRVHDTGRLNGAPPVPVIVPPDTYVHGLRLRVRLDMLERNLLELPHFGLATGGDLALLRRDRWADLGPLEANGRRQFPSSKTRDFLKLSGYLVLVGPVPFLSERHRLVLQLHGGWAPNGDLDRFNAFRLGGGPLPTDANDLARSPYPGAMFDQFAVRAYGVATLEYRLEVLFFLYLHLRATIAVGKIPTFRGTAGPPGPAHIRSVQGHAFSAAVTSGFLWKSSLYLEYTYDSGAIRGGKRGHTILLMWSKSF